MAVDKLKKMQGNSASTTLSASVSDTDTSFPLTSDTNFAGEGMVIIDEGTASEEYAYATGKVGSSLTIPLANRGLEGTSAAGHSSGATVKGVLTALSWNDLETSLENVLLATTGATDPAKVGVLNSKSVVVQVVDGDTSTATGDGKAYFTVPSELNGMNLTAVHARVVTAGTTNTTDIQVANVTDSVDMLSTKLTVDSGETGSDTAATAAVIDTTKDDVATNDLLRIDIDAVSSTAAKGLIVRLQFTLP